MARMTPITMPAIAPPLRPLLDVVLVTPGSEVPLDEAVAGVMYGTVVVAEPVSVVVVTPLLVGLMAAVLDAAVVVITLNKELLLSPLPLLAPHWPA